MRGADIPGGGSAKIWSALRSASAMALLTSAVTDDAAMLANAGKL
jgi:hypothetical protein